MTTTTVESGHVWIVWLHDTVLDVYRFRSEAEARLTTERLHRGGSWIAVSDTKWAQETSSTGRIVARLEIEQRKVIG